MDSLNTKVCKQCGQLKPITGFRKYYGGRKGHYKTCKDCEKINSREKYLAKKDTLTQLEGLELDKIHQLWEVQRAAGLQPPRTATVSTSLVDNIDAMMAQYTTEVTTEPTGTIVAPHDLLQWLSCELTEDPDYYLEDIYESLKDQYRPMLRIENGTTPVYDDTYKETLDKILDRFYAYEDTYYSKE